MISDILDPSVLGAPTIIIALALTVISYVLRNKYSNGLHRIPGPFLASCTDLYRLYIAWTGRAQAYHIALHKRYGPIVRLGPNTLSLDNQSACRTIYGIKSGFAKSAFYPVQATIARGRTLESLFNTRNEEFHARLRRAVASGYAMSTLVEFEPLVEETIAVFLREIEGRYVGDEVVKYASSSASDGSRSDVQRTQVNRICDIGQWLQFYAFDVIGELTFSNRLGFLERGEDVDGIIGNLEWLLRYAAVVGQLPVLDSLFLKNPVRLWLSSMGFLNANSPVKGPPNPWYQRQDIDAVASGGRKRRDFVTHFLEAQKKDPEFITDSRVLTLTVANMFAGSDTTAISLRTIFYSLLRNPDVLQRLLAEISCLRAHQGAGGYLKWTLLSSMDHAPYLNAVIKESLRCHPAAGLLLERVVPPTGLRACGYEIPAGTIVGCNVWVLHQNEEIFGREPGVFRPSRWVEADAERRRAMEGALFSFGAGARSCIGRNISLLEMYKLVPAVLERFELELVDSEKEWKLFNAWFVKQSDFYVKISRRVDA